LDIPVKKEGLRKYAWLPLDNAAKIYPAVRSKEHTTVFRLSVILNERVNIGCLLRAIRKTEARFPYFKVCLRKGFFWYYLEHIACPLIPVADNQGICRAFDIVYMKDALLFRIVVINNRISVEFSHILTDGTGASVFFKTLLLAYFAEKEGKGIDYSATGRSSDIQDQEFEDAYNQYFKADIPPVIQYTKAFHLPYVLNEKPRYHTLTALVSLAEIKSKAREKGASITDYLVAVYLAVLQDIYTEMPRYSRYGKRKILRVQVPINLRQIYPTQSLRNFSLFVLPEIDLRLGQYSFDEIIKIVYHKMKLETDEKLINKIISRNVGSEKNFFVRGIPLFLKDLILYFKYYSQGANQYSGVVTNLGRIELPAEIEKHVDHFVFIPPPPNKKLKVNCGVIGFRDLLVISFGNISRTNDLEKKFFRFLTHQGIRVKLTTY
jgi:NRPS condensation-like uncharacterized protein